MRAKGKGIASDDALQKKIATQEHYKPTVGGFIELGAEEESLFRSLIAEALVFDTTGSTVRMDPDLSDESKIVLDIDNGIHTLKAFVFGWHPTPRFSVVELLRDFRSLGEVGYSCEAVARNLSTRRSARTLLVDGIGNKEIADSMLHELDLISQTVWPRLESLQVLTNWQGQIPMDAVITLTAPQPKEEVQP